MHSRITGGWARWHVSSCCSLPSGGCGCSSPSMPTGTRWSTPRTAHRFLAALSATRWPGCQRSTCAHRKHLRPRHGVCQPARPAARSICPGSPLPADDQGAVRPLPDLLRRGRRPVAGLDQPLAARLGSRSGPRRWAPMPSARWRCCGQGGESRSDPANRTHLVQLFVLIVLGESVARLISAATLRPWSMQLAVVPRCRADKPSGRHCGGRGVTAADQVAL